MALSTRIVALTLVTAAAVVYRNRHWPQPGATNALRGLVEPDAVAVAPVERARIKAIHVTEGQAVSAGDALVEMDTALIAYGVTADVIDTISIETSFGDTHQCGFRLPGYDFVSVNAKLERPALQAGPSRCESDHGCQFMAQCQLSA